MRRQGLLGLFLLAWMLASACTDAVLSHPHRAVAVQHPLHRLVYVAIGASETVGVGTSDPLRDAWPEVFYRTALPPTATFVDLGIPGATVAQALRDEVPSALSLRPQIVTVWLNVNDLIRGVSPKAYARQLNRLLSDLRRGGATEVLVANTPPLDHLPSYLRCVQSSGTCPLRRAVPPPARIDREVAAYNRAVARDARSSGSIVVDLHAVAERAIREGRFSRLISGDGFHPNAAGYRVVAAAFAAAMRPR